MSWQEEALAAWGQMEWQDYDSAEAWGFRVEQDKLKGVLK